MPLVLLCTAVLAMAASSAVAAVDPLALAPANPAAVAPTISSYPLDIERWAGRHRNKRIALEYLQMVNDGKRAEAVRRFAAPTFVNHRSPMSPSAQREANAKAMAAGTQSVPVSAAAPGAVLNARIGRVAAEGDYVFIHYVVTNNADIGRIITGATGAAGGAKVGTNVVDIFKIQSGKIVEKWDALEAIDRLELFD